MSSSMQSDKKESMPPRTAMTGRRRFLGAGSAVTPVILTLFSQPALGATCFTPSRSLSRNTSVTQDGRYGKECYGLPPSSYSGVETSFHSVFVEGSTQGKDKFYKTVDGAEIKKPNGKSYDPPRYEQVSVPMTFGDVIRSFPGSLAAYMIAAYLNCKNGKVPPYVLIADGGGEIPSVTGMWAEWVRFGMYTVKQPGSHPDFQWNANRIILYFQDNAIA